MANEKVICIQAIDGSVVPAPFKVPSVALYEIVTIKNVFTNCPYLAFEFYEKSPGERNAIAAYNAKFFAPLDEFLKSDEFSIEELLEESVTV